MIADVYGGMSHPWRFNSGLSLFGNFHGPGSVEGDSTHLPLGIIVFGRS